MRDRGEADDKIVAVLATDPIWSGVVELADLPAPLLDRLRHYFSTYKQLPGAPQPVELGAAYGRDHAHAVIRAAIADYEREFGAA
jgi:inorganic pyrophosphatase